MKSFTIFNLAVIIILEINIIMGCQYREIKVLPYEDPNFQKNSLPNIYNWDQMMVFIPVTKDPEYNVAADIGHTTLILNQCFFF